VRRKFGTLSLVPREATNDAHRLVDGKGRETPELTCYLTEDLCKVHGCVCDARVKTDRGAACSTSLVVAGVGVRFQTES
jgi:hypothetical protein